MNELETLKEQLYVYRGEYKSNNETVYYYPDADGGTYGVIRYDYDGYPAQGIVLFDVMGYSIEDYSFKTDENQDEEFDTYESEIKEWIEAVLFTTENVGPSGPEAHIDYVGGHTFEIQDPYEGDEYTVKLDVVNERRIE
jgi:hypothetical protein